MTFVNERSDIPGKSRTIDYERNITLSRCNRMGYPGRPPHPAPGEPSTDNFLLKGSDFQIRFEAYLTGKKAADDTDDITWHIVNIWDRESTKGREREVMDILIEAMTEYGVYFGKKNVNILSFEIIPSILQRLGIEDYQPELNI